MSKKRKRDMVPTCTMDSCGKSFSTYGNLNQHIREVHKKLKSYRCDVCDKLFARNTDLKKHVNTIHKKLKPYRCDVCDKSFSQKGNLTAHIDTVHKNLRPFKCQYCSMTFGMRSTLKKHMENIHDIGAFQCQLCLCNRNSQNTFHDDNGNELSICNKCFKKHTGKHTRIEQVWSNYLDEHIGTEFVIGRDQSLRGLGGCSRKRPDRLEASPSLVIISECDENQHRDSNGDYTCDEQRITELYDDPSIMGKPMVVIRFNPDNYKVPTDKKKLTFEDRLDVMVKLTQYVRSNPPGDMITTYYICYDKDSPRLVQNMNYKLIYDEHDIH